MLNKIKCTCKSSIELPWELVDLELSFSGSLFTWAKK